MYMCVFSVCVSVCVSAVYQKLSLFPDRPFPSFSPSSFSGTLWRIVFVSKPICVYTANIHFHFRFMFPPSLLIRFGSLPNVQCVPSNNYPCEEMWMNSLSQTLMAFWHITEMNQTLHWTCKTRRRTSPNKWCQILKTKTEWIYVVTPFSADTDQGRWNYLETDAFKSIPHKFLTYWPQVLEHPGV